MKLLFFIASLQCGGAERVATILCNRWAEGGWEVTVATFDDGRTPPFFPLSRGVRHVALGIQESSKGPVDATVKNLRRVPALRRAIADARPDRIVSFLDSTNVLTLLAARGTGIPVVVAERTDPSRHRTRPPWGILRRLTYARASGIVVQTAAAGAFFPRSWGPRVTVIPNPVPGSSGGAAAERGSERVVAMGRLEPTKGFDLLIRAFARIAEARPSWTLRIFGDGPEHAALASAIERHGLAGRVTLAGRTDDAAGAFRAADLFVLSSRYEGFPNALCEAMATGLPVIAFDCASGPSEIVRDGTDGVLVPPGDVEGLARELLRLTGDPALRRELGARAREVSDRFSVDRVAAAWADLLERVA